MIYHQLVGTDQFPREDHEVLVAGRSPVTVPPVAVNTCTVTGLILMKREFNQKKTGNEVYYTARSLLVMFNNLCSELHRQKDFDLIIFAYKIVACLIFNFQ